MALVRCAFEGIAALYQKPLMQGEADGLCYAETQSEILECCREVCARRLKNRKSVLTQAYTEDDVRRGILEQLLSTPLDQLREQI